MYRRKLGIDYEQPVKNLSMEEFTRFSVVLEDNFRNYYSGEHENKPSLFSIKI